MQIFVKRFFFPSVLIFFIALAQALWAQSPDIAPESTKKNEPGIPREPDKPTPSPFERRMVFEKRSEHNPFVILPHKPTYFLPLTYNTSANDEPFKRLTGDNVQPVEIKFQFSLKVLMMQKFFKKNNQLAFAYTQQSNWQAYQFQHSSPFRETNYEAELMFSFFNHSNFMGYKNRMTTLGLSHHSNGRADNFSRSWNRFYINFIFEKRNLLLSIKPWIRIPDKTKRDENPDIEKFYGYGEILAHYRLGDYTFGFVLRNNMRKNNKGAIQVDWTFPLYGKTNGYFQYFNGYGETLIDYQNSTNRFGLGIILTNWL